MDKRGTVIESIQKLLSLGVGDQEIIESLNDVGIEKDDAVSLLREAKTLSAQKASSEEPMEAIKKAITQQPESMDADIVKQVSISKEKPKREQEISPQSSKSMAAEVSRQNEEELKDLGEQKEFEDDSAKQGPPEGQGDESEERITGELLVKSYGPRRAKKAEKQKSQKAIGEELSLDASSTRIFGGSAKSYDETRTSPLKSADKKNDEAAAAKTQPADEKILPQTIADLEPDEDVDELWKKGIVTAVNAKLSEMKKLKDGIDEAMQQRVDESIRKELYQFKVLLDSQKDLIISTNKEALEQKQNEIMQIIDAKITEVRAANRQLGDSLAQIENIRKQQEQELAQLNLSLEEAKKSRTQMVIEMNSELIKVKSQAQDFLTQSAQHISQLDERINKTLELEKHIAEGMLQEAEQKIDSLAIARADELIGQMQVELNKIQATSKKVSPDLLDQKMKILDDFRKQFIDSMQESLTQINSSITDLNRRNAMAERTLQEKTLAIDAKLEELTRFEKDFTDLLEKSISKKK